MLFVFGALLLLLLVLAIPSGHKCPKCEKHFTRHFKADATRVDSQKQIKLEFSHCFYCQHKWNITEDGKAIDENGNLLDS